MKENWKGWLVIGLVVGVGFFAYLRWRSGFGAAAPRFIELRETDSPSHTWNTAVRQSWPHVETLLRQLDYEMDLTGRARGTLRVAVIQDAAEPVVFWSSVELVNPGFAPITRYETGRPFRPDRFLGYYNLAGEPLRFVTKKDPREPGVLHAAIVLDEPLEAGTTATLLRVDHRADLVKTNKAGHLAVGLGRLVPSPDRIDAIELVLPKGAQLVRHQPEDAADQSRKSDRVSLIWLSTFMDDPQPVGATFKVE